MASGPAGNKCFEEFKRGQKPSDESKEYLKRLSAARYIPRPGHSSLPKESMSPLRVGPGLMRRRGKKLVDVALGGNPRLLLPCTPQRAMAMASANVNNGYWVGSDFQVGSPVESLNYPDGLHIELHTYSSLVRPETGEFSLCAVVNNKSYNENYSPPSNLYPPEITFGNIQATEAKGSVWQIFNIPAIYQKKPKGITATAVLSADHVMSSTLIESFSAGCFAGLYGQADITLYGGLDIVGVPPPSASQIIDFLVAESSGGICAALQLL
jgi:hypothetical protein